MMIMVKYAFILFFGVTLMPGAALAMDWEVGPDKELKTPSAAAALVKDGDSVRIDAGTYQDCAVWRANLLTIVGLGDVIVRDKVCEDKALFITRGSDITILNITFMNGRASDHLGAGILSEGVNLTVEDSRFIDNENGILVPDRTGSQIAIHHDTFQRNGLCSPICTHAVNVGRVQSLSVLQSTFVGQKQGHNVRSRALDTQLLGDEISDGPDGTASLAVDIPDGGRLTMSECTIEKGPKTGNHSTAISIGEESNRNQTPEIRIDHTSFTNNYAKEPVTFLVNKTRANAQLATNTMHGTEATWLSGPGRVAAR
jgi:hypothetical protein